MNIGFDMDGVLRRLDLSMMKFRDAINNKTAHEALEMHMRRETEPWINPGMFALPDDEIFCITNCSSQNGAERKREWLRHFYGNRVKIAPTFGGSGKWGKEYVDDVARQKLDVCYKCDIEVYFDDDPAIIRVMRELHAMDVGAMDGTPEFIKFIKYGAWLEEVYIDDPKC